MGPKAVSCLEYKIHSYARASSSVEGVQPILDKGVQQTSHFAGLYRRRKYITLISFAEESVSFELAEESATDKGINSPVTAISIRKKEKGSKFF
jgi:hypothetical protein